MGILPLIIYKHGYHRRNENIVGWRRSQCGQLWLQFHPESTWVQSWSVPKQAICLYFPQNKYITIFMPWGCYTQCSSHNRTMAFHTASRALSRLFPGIKAQGIIIFINSSKSCFYTVYLYIQYIRIQFYHLFFRLHRFI